MRLSAIADRIQTSPILTLAAEINDYIARGETFYNLTVGDFNPKVFPIPAEFRDAIVAAYNDNQTNYPGAVGLPKLRNAVSAFLKEIGGLEYGPDEIFIASGGRPFLYAAYRAVVNPGEKVIFPVPSWNNDYYTTLSDAVPVMLETAPENNFMPTAEMIEPHLGEAALVALCSPLNPTGTAFSEEKLAALCDLILAENRRRGRDRKPVYLIFDQIYWPLTFGETRHHNPVSLRPEMRDYTIFVDGMSKTFSATGVRLGWGFGPTDVTRKMRSMVAHMGAWAPRAEQVAAGNYLSDLAAVRRHLTEIRGKIQTRLEGFYDGFVALREKGYPVNAIEPQAAMYLTVQLDLVGKTTADGRTLASSAEVHRYILEDAKVGLVPFSYFGASEDSTWYRLSVGTCRAEDVPVIMDALGASLAKLR